MTPEQKILLSSNHVHNFVVNDRSTGQVIAQGDVVHPFTYRRYTRPKSSTNPVRPDKTRRPSDWSSDWFDSSEGLGFSQLQQSTSVVSSRGQLVGNSIVDRSLPSDSTMAQLRNTRLRALAHAVEESTQLNAALAQSKDVVKLANRYLQAANRWWYKPGRRGEPDFREEVKRLFRKNGRARRWATIPNEYLAYLYGIAPLGDDLANGLDRLTSYRLKGYGMSMLLKASETRREILQEPINVYCAYGNYPSRVIVNRVQKTRAVYRFDLPSWYLDSAPTRTPFSTAYELAPYSFVLDWFVPVGSWIQALESAQFSPFFREGSETWLIKDTCDLSTATSSALSTVRLSGQYKRGAIRRTSVLAYPSSILTRPACNVFPGIQQISQGLSLLAQALQRWY